MGHTFVSSSMGNRVTTALTIPYNCAAGTTLLVAHVLTAGAPAVARTGSAVTYNSVAMTDSPFGVRRYSVTGETTVELWYMLDPPTGTSYNIVVPNDGGTTMRVYASSYSAGAGFTSAYDTGSTGATISADPVVTVVTNYDGCVVVDVLGSGRLAAPEAGQTLLYATDEGIYSTDCQYYLQTTAGNAVMNWTVATDDWAQIAAAFRPVSTTVDQTSWGYVSFLHDELANY